MTYAEAVEKFLSKVDEIRRSNPVYKQPGDGSDGTCDCIGLEIGALRRMGLKWKGIHGSNYAARYETVELHYINRESDLELGDIVYKACTQVDIVNLACGRGTKTHKYDLPDRYKKNGRYYDGDLKDYYHVGIVTNVNPLRITHMTTPTVKVDTNLNGGWNYHGKAKPLWNAASSHDSPITEPEKPVIAEPVPEVGSKAIVVAENGYPVKMREYPSTGCRTWEKVNVGSEVTIVQPGEEWAKIDYGRRKGWYMMAKFLDVVGDGKGKY